MAVVALLSVVTVGSSAEGYPGDVVNAGTPEEEQMAREVLRAFRQAFRQPCIDAAEIRIVDNIHHTLPNLPAGVHGYYLEVARPGRAVIAREHLTRRVIAHELGHHLEKRCDIENGPEGQLLLQAMADSPITYEYTGWNRGPNHLHWPSEIFAESVAAYLGWWHQNTMHLISRELIAFVAQLSFDSQPPIPTRHVCWSRPAQPCVR